MAFYRVRPNRRFGPNGEYGPGDFVELDSNAALGFPDKLEYVSEVDPRGDKAEEKETGLKNDLDVQIDPAMKLLPPEEEFGVRLETDPKPAKAARKKKAE